MIINSLWNNTLLQSILLLLLLVVVVVAVLATTKKSRGGKPESPKRGLVFNVDVDRYTVYTVRIYRTVAYTYRL
jgi:hypothetical protein